MAQLVHQTPSVAGATPALSPVNSSDTMLNTGREFLWVHNGNASPTNVTITSAKLCDQGSTHNLVVAVPAGTDRLIGPFPVARFSDPDTGLLTIGYSVTASVTAGAFKSA